MTEGGPARTPFSTFRFEIFSDLQESCKNSTKNSHYTLHSDSSHVTVLHNHHSTMIKIRKLMCLKYCDLIYRHYLNFANSIVSFNLEAFLSLALSFFILEEYLPLIL